MPESPEEKTVWACPQCGKRFRVPSHLKPPAKCRECKQKTALVHVDSVPTIEVTKPKAARPVESEILDVEFVVMPQARKGLSPLSSAQGRWFAAIIALGLAWFVWPTPYEYSTSFVDGERIVTRTSRMTGLSQTRYLTGWDKPGDIHVYRRIEHKTSQHALHLETRTSRVSGREQVFFANRWMPQAEYVALRDTDAKAIWTLARSERTSPSRGQHGLLSSDELAAKLSNQTYVRRLITETEASRLSIQATFDEVHKTLTVSIHSGLAYPIDSPSVRINGRDSKSRRWTSEENVGVAILSATTTSFSIPVNSFPPDIETVSVSVVDGGFSYRIER